MIWLKGIGMNFANDEEETPITNNEWFSIFGDEHFDTILKNKFQKEMDYEVTKFSLNATQVLVTT